MKRNLYVGTLPCLLALCACGGQASSGGAEASTSPLHATYLIEGESVTLHNGRAEQTSTPGSAMKVRTSLWDGSKVYGDLDADGDDDAALVLMQEAGGTGTFSYLAAALRQGDGYVGTGALFLGDRIGPPELIIREGIIEVRFQDHADNEAFVDTPTQNSVVRAKLQGHALEAL